MKKVLFGCVENTGRSQMAEAFANHYSNRRVVAHSAGMMPSERVNPTVVQAMREKGVDLSEKKPKLIDLDEVRDADVVITMGCGAEGFCPAPLLEKVVEWGIEEPKGKPIERVRKIRDEIEGKVLKLMEEIV